ncbi:hypothetical protein HHI36_007324 [Cryptolaemus montrouzieri]|uniref:Calponin-homology (CH) domain-containing protein n=1 Tax=Cryptolaemus montrouzieri TaxID=559131 RepID=A0ABD2MPC2_9CUCU
MAELIPRETLALHSTSDEQERVQKKTFVNWINSYLSKRVPPLRVNDLIEDLKDGTKLLALLEVLSGEKLPVERGRILRRPHFLSNANTALQFLQNKRIKLVNINASDLVDGRPPVVLGLIWTIILYFQIEENSRALEYLALWGSQSSLESAGTTASRDKWKMGARKTLLNWVANALPRDSGIEVRDFGASWRDGVAFLAIIDAIKKNIVDIAALKRETNRIRLETAFDVAESELGITRLLDPEDVDVPKPDEKSIMTYVAQFLNKYPEPGSGQQDVIITIQEQYGELLTWLRQKTQYLEHLQRTDSLPLDFNEYLAFKSEVDEREKLYTKLKQLIESQSLVTLTRESWIDIIALWEKLQLQLLQWLWLIDSKLPGDFKFIGEWLAKAERLIYCDEIPSVMNDETAAIISRKLEEHKAFFVDYPTVKQKFLEACSSPLAKEVPSEKLNNLNTRLNEIGPKATQRRVRLKFLEHKCCLIAFLQLTETKLKVWTAKYGRLEKVTPLLDQYRNFVSKNNIFQEFNKAFIDMKAVIQEYKQDGNISKHEKTDTDLFINEIAEKWKNVSMELRCVQSMLEEVVAYWRRWDSLSPKFENWLIEAENALNLSEDEKIEFFQDITVWRDNYQLLGDTVSFLIATCNDQVAMELRDQYHNITIRWEKLFPLVNKYSHSGDLLRNKKDFRNGIEMLSEWLRKAENIINSPQLGSTENIIKHIDKLVHLQSEIESVENIFKTISKTFQSLIQDLSRDEVEKMMVTLKQEKEALVKMRALIPAQIHLFNQVLVQQKSLEDGQKEINAWLDDAENLLGNLSLIYERDSLKSHLEKVKQFFTRTLYYKSMLDSKNKVMMGIIKTVDRNENSDVAQMIEKMDQLNDRFGYVTQNAQVWEQRLQETIRCLHNFTDCHRNISNWLNQAERLIEERRIDNKEIVEDHKNFFTSVNEKWMHDLIQHSQDLCSCLPKEQHKPILNSVSELQNKWKQVLSFAPLHLMKLEFRLDETTFNYYLKELEKEIHSEHLAFSKQTNVGSIINRNKEYFSSAGPLAEAQKCLESLKKIATTYTAHNPADTSVQQAVEHAEKQWKSLNTKIENLNKELQQIPEKWDEYHKKFEEITKWMDHVNESLSSLLTTCQSFEEFDQQKEQFQKICEEADLKRQDMKWLVQTLDFLVSQYPISQAETEQKKLDELLIRYKNLIPSLEITMVKTETLSKCYSYRREVREVCDILRKVREVRTEIPQPNDLNHLISVQQNALTHLDSQRPSIMSILQKGKDLERDINAPEFIQEEVQNLERNWSETYNTTVKRLNELRETQQTLTSYEKQKNEINLLLSRAEQQLKEIHPSEYNLASLPAELKQKQEQAIHLREKIEEMLRRLREFSIDLPEQAPVLEKEIREIEIRYHNALDNTQKNIVNLEQYTIKMNSFQDKLSKLQEWTLSKAPLLLESVQQEDISPQEKMVKTEALQKEIIHNITLLKSLDNEVQEIQIHPEKAPKLQAELLTLREKVEAVNKDAENRKAIICQDLKNWEVCQANLRNAQPWLEKAEQTIRQGLKKPSTLEEAILMKTENDEFAKECQVHSNKLQGILSLSHQLSSKTPAHDEIDSSLTKHTIIFETVHQWDKKLDKLVANWEKFDSDVQELETWLRIGENNFSKKSLILSIPEIDKLETQLSELKTFNNELSEQQAKIIGLTQGLDAISYYISPEGLNVNKQNLQQLKARINQLAEGVRAKINEYSDSILAKHESQAKINNFATWIYDFQNNVSQFDEVLPDNLDTVLINIHSLLQEHSEKQPVFNDIYEEIKEIVLRTSGPENKAISNEYTNLAKNYQEVRDNLQNKKNALKEWSELLNWYNESLNQLQHLDYQIESKSIPQETLQAALPEMNVMTNNIIIWKEKIPTMENMKNITIINKQTGLPLSAEQLVREIELKTINLKSNIEQRIESMDNLKKHWQTFKNLEGVILGNLNDLKQNSSNICSLIQKPSDLVVALEQINKLLESQAENSKHKDNLRKEGLYLTKEDIQNVSVIQASISQVESEWSKVIDSVRDQKLVISDTLAGWNDFQEAKSLIAAEILNMNEGIQNFDTPNDLLQATANCAKAKKLLDAFKRFKVTLDKLEGKGQAVIKNCDEAIPILKTEIKNEIQEISQSCSTIYEQILSLVQKTESQATIWKDIDATKNDLMKWLSEQNDSFIIAIEKPNEVETANMKLAKYREELPLYTRLKQSLPVKYNQITKLSNENISPIQVLIQVINDQFETVDANARKLDELTSNFGEAKKKIQDKIKAINNKIGSLREQIIKCEDLGGDNRQIVQRVLKIKELKKSLVASEGEIKELEQNIKQIKVHYPNLIEGVFPKEQQLLKKRYDDLINHSNKIENSLLSFLKKVHSEKFGVLQRIVSTHKEKIDWCVPENLSDKYNLEIKLKSLIPISKALEESEIKASEVENSLALLAEVEHPEVVKLLTAEKDHLFLEMNDMKTAYVDTKDKLESAIGLHERYEKITNEIDSWLKDKENEVKVSSSAQINIDDLQEKTEKIMALNKEIVGYETGMNQLKPIGEELSQDTRITQYIEHLNTRYVAMKQFLSNYLEKLEELKKYKERYLQSVQDVENWLTKAEDKVKSFTQLSAKPDQTTLQELRGFAVEKEQGQKLLDKALENGEALFPGITPDNREHIRIELRVLREKAEGLIEKVSSLYKNVETILTQKQSIEESLQQIRTWMNETTEKIGGDYVLDNNLPEKRETLHNYKILNHDIDLHKTILQKLKDTLSDLSNVDTESSLNQSIVECENLISKSKQYRATAEDYVKQHENYDSMIENCQNWLDALTSEAVLLMDETVSDSAESKSSMIQDLLSQKEQGDQIIKNCKEQLQCVLEQTAEGGHAALIASFEEQEKAWNSFLQFCISAQEKLDNISSQYSKLDAILKDLEEWLRVKENQVKDQSLKNTEETKRAHLKKLESLNDIILSKDEDFQNLSEYSNIDSNLKIPTLITRYESLRNASKEAIKKYEFFVEEHKQFNDNYNDFVHWLSDKTEDLHGMSHIVGDMAVLQNRNKETEALIEERNKKSAEFDALLEKGEKLYSHTSPDGREIIRQQLKNLRTIWDSFADDLQNASYKLDQCLVQFSDFTMTQEQLTKWLKDVEKAMQQHTELKATLQEKRAQLQNHKIMHQEIMSHQQLVEAVCDKAQKLVDQTQDKSLNVYLQSIKQLFVNIVNKSEELLNNLDGCVKKHIDFHDSLAAFKEWLRGIREKLQEYNETLGEKPDIEKKISAITTAKSRNQQEGQQLLEKIKEKLISAAKSTAPAGVDTMKAELQEAYSSFEEYLTEIDKCLARQNSFLLEWKNFDKNLDELTKWCKSREVILREQPLQDTLDEKITKCKHFQDERDAVSTKEVQIDQFVDLAHSLAQSSRVQKIQPLVAQLSTKYQQLLSLAKDVVNRWQTIVDDHKNYHSKLQNTETWLKQLENNLDILKSENVEDLSMRLQLILAEKDQGEQKVATLTSIGENLLPDTATHGREIIRNELRNIRERWDKLFEDVKSYQKDQEAQTQQLSSYQDILQQTLAWLNSMEKNNELNPSQWNSIQEIRSKLLKHKTMNQEILGHRKIIADITARARDIIQITNNQDKIAPVEEQISSINNRFEALMKNCQANIKQLEDSLEIFHQFYEFHKNQQDYQKQQWDKLNNLNDLSRGKEELQERLAQLVEIQDNIGENSLKIKDLEKFAASKVSILPARIQEQMQRDIANLSYDQNKFISALTDVKSNLESRLTKWNDFENSLERLLSSLNDAETILKNYVPKSTADEKLEQLEKYQQLSSSLSQTEREIDKLSDDINELVQNSGDSRVSVNIQQITSRFQSIQLASREILKKCEQVYTDHKFYNEKYRQCADWIAAAKAKFFTYQKNVQAGSRAALSSEANVLVELLAEEVTANLLLNNVVELGEKLYPNTTTEGREIINNQLKDLQQSMETLFDNLNTSDRELKSNLTRWSSFEDSSAKLNEWLGSIENQLTELKLWTTLDEKKNQHEEYKNLAHEIISHKEDIMELKEKLDMLPKSNESLDQELANMSEKYEDLLKKAQEFAERYESIENNHIQFNKVVAEVRDWLDSTHTNILAWNDSTLDRTNLQANLEKLKNLKASLRDEESRVLSVKTLGERIIQETNENGRPVIRAEIENIQIESAKLLSLLESSIDQIQNKLRSWHEYDQLKEQCLEWLRNADDELYSIDLKATAEEKKAQLDRLKTLQGHIRAKELEIDQVTEKAQQLTNGANKRNSQIPELEAKYQKVSHKVKEMTSRWQQFVVAHQDLDSQIAQTEGWLQDLSDKLSDCKNIKNATQKDIERKIGIIQEIFLKKEESFQKVQSLVESAQAVLANTAPSGHNAINEKIAALQEEWSAIASSMIETKNILDNAMTKWTSVIEEIYDLDKTIQWMKAQIAEHSVFGGSMSEKKNQLESLKKVEEKARCDKIEVANLRQAANVFFASRQGEDITKCQNILDEFDNCVRTIQKLLMDKECQLRDHKMYKEAYDELQRWMTRAQEKVPQLKQRPLSDKLTVEIFSGPLDHLLNKKAQGEILIEHLEHTAQVVLPHTSEFGQETIKMK